MSIMELPTLALAAGLFACSAAIAQPPRNFIRAHVMLDSAGTERRSAVTYYDGLGRSEQTVAEGASPSGADLVRHSSRDRAGRIARRYNAAPSSGGGYVPESQISAAASDAYGDDAPYSLAEYERSPLGRRLAATGAGQAWHAAGKSIRVTYLANSASDGELRCRRFSASDTRYAADTAVTVTPKGFYPAGSLHVTRTVDEDGRVKLVFTDKLGRTVLTRTALDGGHADTYYVRDVAGNLTAVFPPALSAIIGDGGVSSADADARAFAYFYIYDWHGLCRARKLPGRDWQVTVRDRGGRVVLTQDGNMRRRGEALFHLSDALGRVCAAAVVPGYLSVADARLDINALAERDSGTDSLGGYAVAGDGLALPGCGLLSAAYYDDYGFLDGKPFGGELAYRGAAGFDGRHECADDPAISAKGLLTGTATRVLGDSATLHKAVYYDSHGNVVQSHEQNAMGGYDRYYYRLSFTGKPLALRHEHSTADTCHVYVYSYTYDGMERLLSVSAAKDGGAAVTLVRNVYDGLGRLQKRLLGDSPEGAARFGYNARGWLTELESPHFSQTLRYEAGFEDSAPCWSGDVSAVEWTSKGCPAAPGGVRRAYKFRYDGLGRLKSAVYSSPAAPEDGSAGRPTLLNARDYSCSYAYDLNGNVTSLRRMGVAGAVTAEGETFWTFGIVDDLTLDYDGNQLRKAADYADELTYSGAMDFRDGADAAAEYAYDANGNMTLDRNKGISLISYNVLNLPREVEFADGHIIRYTYAADGAKLRAEYLLRDTRLMGWEEKGPVDGIAPLSLTDPKEGATARRPPARSRPRS